MKIFGVIVLVLLVIWVVYESYTFSVALKKRKVIKARKQASDKSVKNVDVDNVKND